MLTSRLFSKNAALQNCAVQDQGHLTPGSSGDAVALLQRALVAISQADISEQEIRKKFYGPTTAHAVLKYKSQRNIINRAYQTQPDDIVGKMTIVSLDQEMFRLEAVSFIANIQKDGALF